MADATVTPLQVATLAWLAGFPYDQLANAGAVAGAESSLNPKARNSAGASGLFQVLESAHPEFKKQWDSAGSITGWDDPAENTYMAYQVWKQAGGWEKPWVQTYKSPRYYTYLPAAQAAADTVQQSTQGKTKQQQATWALANIPEQDRAAVQALLGAEKSVAGGIAQGVGEGGQVISSVGPAIGSSIEEVAAPLKALGDFFGALALPSTWVRIVCGIAGIGAVLGGVLLLGKEAKE